MKKTLLSAICLVSLGGFAQTVNNFYTDSTTPEVNYVIGTGTPTESTTGQDVTWDFSSLTNAGTSTGQVITPTSSQVSTYPNTALVAESTGEYNGTGTSSTLNILTTGAGVITGISLNNFTLNYNTNNANLGTFPLNYGYTNTDQVAGNFTAMGYSGTFSGTCVTSVDGYGTINSSIGALTGIALTRLKIVQNLTLYYLGIAAGTATQTLYMYYSANNTMPMARSMYTNISIPVFSINRNLSVVELYQSTANVASVQKNTVAVLPNPAGNVLHINGIQPEKIIINDVSGKTILSSNGNDTNISILEHGIYYATIFAGTTAETVKFVKK